MFTKLLLKIYKDDFEFKKNQTKVTENRKKNSFFKRIGRNCRLM